MDTQGLAKGREEFIEQLKAQGFHVTDEVRRWPIKWLVYRLSVNPSWDAVYEMRDWLLANEGQELTPLVVCSRCFVPLDGWHRLAAYWLANRRFVPVRFSDMHFFGQDFCRIDKPPGIEFVRAWAEMKSVSGVYYRQDMAYPLFMRLFRDLTLFGGEPPNVPMRIWERTRSVLFAVGWPSRKRVLDIGTRESLVPHYLAAEGAECTAVDLDVQMIKDDGTIKIQQADARELPFDGGGFDSVLCTSVIKLIPGQGDTRAVQEMIRVLRPGGLAAITVDFWKEYCEFPSATTGRRIYTKEAIYGRLVDPVKNVADLMGPVDFDSTNWDEWPFKGVWTEQGVNLQVAVIVLRKRGP